MFTSLSEQLLNTHKMLLEAHVTDVGVVHEDLS